MKRSTLSCFALLLGWATAIQQGTTLEWADISCKIKDKEILKGVSGQASPGRLLAILGPSGSGKTTLLNSLCGQVPKNDAMELLGQVRCNDRPRDHNQKQAYIKQEDVFFSQLTVLETLTMAARLKLPRTMTREEKDEEVQEVMGRLGLGKVANTIVGDEKARGISGGEKKRLNLACELLGTPSLIFADEPTTGLDSFQAERVMEALRDLARDGHTVVCVIHQPRGSIFNMFDDLLVLSEGNVMYHGPARKVASYFNAAGFKQPPNCNPAEHALDLVSIDYSSHEQELETKQRVQQLAQAHRLALSRKKGATNGLGSVRARDDLVRGGNGDDHANDLAQMNMAVVKKAGMFEQFRLLMARSWRQVNRSKFANVTRAMTQLTSGLLFGAIFWKIGLGQSHIGDRLGLLQVAAINTAMGTVIKTLTTFPKECSILQNDRAAGKYQVLPYFLSKVITELPISGIFPNIFGLLLYNLCGLNPREGAFVKFLGILTLEAFACSAFGMLIGAVTNSEDAALALGPALMSVFIIFSGAYINMENVPAALRWCQELSIIRWAYEAFCVNEMRGLKFFCDGPKNRGPCIETGEQMLDRIAFGESTVQSASLGLGKILAGCYFLTYLSLELNKPKFQTMLAPQETEEAVRGGAKVKRRRWFCSRRTASHRHSHSGHSTAALAMPAMPVARGGS
ncbi:unnamed protein product [Chrysoparadoxa australica]